MIYAINSHRWYAEIKDEFHQLLDEALSEQRALSGKFTTLTEELLAQMTGRKYAVLVQSGSAANLLMLLVKGIKPGDEIITTPFACNAMVVPIKLLGANPVFPDINRYGSIDLFGVEKLITKKTKAFFGAGMFGDMYDFDMAEALCKRYSLIHLNDACQAIFSEYRTKPATALGELASVSFGRGKHIPIIGSYGAILTDNPNLKEQLLSARFAGKRFNGTKLESLGINSEPSEDKAVQCYITLKKAIEWHDRRLALVELYMKWCQNEGIKTRPHPEYSKCSYNRFTIFVKDKNKVASLMKARDIQCTTQYNDNYALEPLVADPVRKREEFPMTQFYIDHALHLPLNPWLTEAELKSVMENLIDVLDSEQLRFDGKIPE